jgi:hypothetical protein
VIFLDALLSPGLVDIGIGGFVCLRKKDDVSFHYLLVAMSVHTLSAALGEMMDAAASLID